MEEVGNAGFSEWLRPPVSDSEVLLLTSFNGHQLENCMGASLLTRKESGHDDLGIRQVNHEGVCDGDVDSSRFRVQSEAVVPYDYYSDGEYPVLIHTRQASDMLERYVDPFRVSSSFDARPGIGVDVGQTVKFVPNMDGYEQKSVSLFPQSGTTEDGILQENLNENAREDQACDAACTEEYEVQKECRNENAREDRGSDAVSTDIYEIENKRIAGIAGENQPCNAQGVWPVHSVTRRDLKLAETSKGEVCHGVSFEMSSNQAGNVGSVENFEGKKDCSDEIARENPAFYAGKDLEVVAEKPERQLCPDMSIEMDSALEAEGEATMNQEDAILAQTPLEISIKPIVCKSFMRKKPNNSRKRASRKNSASPKLEELVPLIGGGADLLNTNKSEGLATSTCPEADVIDEPTYSSSLVPYTELPSDGSNEGSLKYQAPSEATNTDSAVALDLSNKNIAGEIIGRSTRSRAHGKICKRPIVQDSLFDESNLIFANKMTGKRSTICKTVRSTIWGDLENLKEGPEKKGKVVKSEPSSLHTELGRTDIEAEVLQSQGGRKRGSGVRRLQSGKFCDNGQPEQVKFPMVGSCRNSAEKTNTKHNKGVLHEQESVVASSGFKCDRLNVQGGELLCLNGDAGSGEGTMNQKNMEEERKFLEIQRYQCPIDQSMCYSPLEVQKSLAKEEEENAADEHSSESTMCTDETKYHNSIKTETSPKGFNAKNNFDYRVHENENDACNEEQVAITTKEIHGNSIDTRTKPLEESRSNDYASVPKIEKCGINLGMGLAETQSSSVSCRNLQSQKGFQYGRDLIDTKDRSNKLNKEILKFEEQSETKMLHPEARTVEMHLDEFAKSGTSMESLDTCKTEYRDNELHDMVSATSHADPTGIVGQQELRKRKAKRKGKLKGKSEFPEAGLDVAEVTVASVNMLQDENAVKRMRKSKWKKSEKSIYMQRKKSNLQNQRMLLDADGSDQLFVSEDLLSGQMERKANPEPNVLKSKDTAIFVKEKRVEHASFETEGLESMLLQGKNQARKNIKNISGGNKKTELMGSIRERKRKVVRQKNNAGDKKSSYCKSNCVQTGLENSLRTNDKAGEGLRSLSSNNDPNSFGITEQQKEDIGDLDGIKGQSDSSTDAASPMKMAHSSSSVQMNHEPKHEFSVFSQDLAENLLLENKTLERQEVAGEDISSGVNEEGAKMIMSEVRKYDENIERHCEQPRVGWALCVDCRKWRCIAGELADAIDETDCKCSCQGNPNREFADCSIPQEKLNAEINAESNISDVSCEEGDWNGAPIESNHLACMQAQDTQEAAWTLIKQNMYLHRSRKTPVIDEMMVCRCKAPKDGSLGCGDECLNRMLNIECVQGTCPCGDLCSNQQFQKRQYAKVQCFRCDKNCFGLQALEDVAKGTFLIEYVGEVLDVQGFEARKKEYASRSQKHSYFVTLNSIEVIDACVKGNLGRFINHSCDPNCHTEKWMVNGEVCIGFFAIRDIKKGEELTSDYNHLQVIGDVAKKCECGSAECRGFIGGDPSVPEAILPRKLDENCEVPGMLQEDSENEGSQDNKVSLTRECSTLGNVVEGELSSQPSERKSECSSALFEKQAEVSNNFGIIKKVNTVSNLGNAFNLKKSKVPTNVEDFEGGVVEEKLNELLDSEGGICGGKDATKDYLKLLLVTAASGDTDNTAVSHSIRDVSLVLDALLKTRSPTVLFDIMNKNGLQMLLNILKQNCKNYIKIPIVRKLMKVIEFLAENDVLSVDQINSGPACRASESFQALICALTGHNDSQVQQIARRFQDKWIPHIIKNAENKKGLVLNKVGLIFNDYEMNSCGFSVKEPKMVPRQTDAIDCLGQTPVEQENVADGLSSRSDQYEFSHGTHGLSFPGQDGSEKLNGKNALDGWKTGTKDRKRKSRWDQPTELTTQQISSQTNLKCGEINIENGKDSGSLIVHRDKENNAETNQDVSTSGGLWSSEQNHETNIDGNVACSFTAVQSAISSCPPSEVMSMSNAPGTFGKEQSSLQFPMQQVPGRVESCVGSSCTLSCSTDVPSTQPYMVAHHSKTVYGYPLKTHGNIVPHWPLSYGIPINLLGSMGRLPTPFPDSMSQSLSTHRPHCPSSNNPISSTVIPNMRPCPGQPVVGCFPRNPQHQLQPFNISLPMQSSARPLQNVRQTFQMHPGQAVRQCASGNPDYVEPEPPVPGLSPSKSSETPRNSNWPVRGRNKVGHGQTGKPGKRQGKQQRFNYPRFSNYKGPSDRKYKDCFPQKKYSSFKGTWKNRISANFRKDCSLHHPSDGNNLHLQNLQQNSEHVNIANFSEAVSNNFSTFH